MSKYKTRLVAKGYAQTYGIDYEETYSPVAKMTIVRIIIAMASTKRWSLHQMDVKNGQSMDVPIVICCDNNNSILLANNLIYHARTKHIEVHCHFVRKKILAREINLIHVSTEDQIVDIFTKALDIDKLKRF